MLLYGPPGTGKTLLARAVAGEAGVPFYSISGSDFVEMFVGVGASRVRDLFEQAKANAPSIIFVDEIDAVGRHRGAGMGGGHDEREQTLNQLLVEMDGFDVKGGVILIAATNRPDILDPALLRPGRFDRQIAVGPPDVLGREAVLKVHAKGKPFAQDVDLGVIARRTPGFTGADLANVINEAALLTARNNGRLITTEALEESIDRVIAGPERKTRAMSDKEKRVTAYHEAGHALTAWAMPNLDPVHKVTILPRGRSLGHTLVLPLEDRYTQTRSEILDQLVYALGGRAAEELVFHEPTTGASNDIEKATGLARVDGHRVRHELQARRGQVRHRRRRAVHGPRLRPPARLLRRDRGRHRRRGARPDRGRARRGLGDPGPVPRRARRDGARAGREGDAGQARPRADPGARCASARRTTRSPASASARPATGRRSRSRRRCASPVRQRRARQQRLEQRRQGQRRRCPGSSPSPAAPAPPRPRSGAFGPPQHYGVPYGGYRRRRRTAPRTTSRAGHGQGGGQGPA